MAPLTLQSPRASRQSGHRMFPWLAARTFSQLAGSDNVAESSTLATLAEATAHRLRLVQADAADDPPEARAKVLSEQIREALAKVVPEQRQQFLTELETRFPVFEDGDAAAPQAAEAPAEPADPLTLAAQPAAKGA